MARLRAELIPKIKQFFHLPAQSGAGGATSRVGGGVAGGAARGARDDAASGDAGLGAGGTTGGMGSGTASGMASDPVEGNVAGRVASDAAGDAAGGVASGPTSPVRAAPRMWQGVSPTQRSKAPPGVLAIGVYTGGPAALSSILPELPPAFPLPVLVVQHMPPLFTRLLAERLRATCRLPVEEASQDHPVEGGKILIAPGDFHLKVAFGGGGVRVCLDQSPPQNSCRPAVDALFASIAEVYRGAAIAVILTGMGQDGFRGAEILKARGAFILAQDEATSVVWGMPGAVVKAGLAGRVLALDQAMPEILRLAARR
jgi:chemotaxis response regulator CheB